MYNLHECGMHVQCTSTLRACCFTGTESQSNGVFSASFDLCPVAHDTDYALDIGVQPIEIVYDEVRVCNVR